MEKENEEERSLVSPDQLMPSGEEKRKMEREREIALRSTSAV